MTKHLRFLFVMLLAMIWSAGWAQTTVDFTNGVPNGWGKTKVILAQQKIDGMSCIQLQKNWKINKSCF